jgi:hypothetical protein
MLSEVGKWIVFTGLALILLGGVLWLIGRVPFLGRLPGDIHFETDGVSCFIPLATSILLSLLLTLLFNLIRILRK